MNEEMITMLRDIKRSINVLLKNVWSVSDLASVLDLSESRIRHMAADGLFPYYKQKGCLYFRREEIEAWLTTHRHESQDEINAKAENYISLKRRKA